MTKFISAIAAVLLCFLLALALSACGKSSSAASATPSVVTNLAVSAGSQQVTISWDTPSTNIPTYNIYWYANDNTKVNKIANVTSPYIHTGLDNTKTYYYVVTQVVGGVESAESLQVSASPQAVVPAAPDGLSISATGSQVTLAFDKNVASQPSSATYNVYYNYSSSTTHSVSKTSYATKIAYAAADFGPTTTTSITIPSLAKTTTPYYFAVTAVVNGVESNVSASNVLTATPTAATAAKDASGTTLGWFSAPDNLKVEPGNLKATLSWSTASATTAGVAGSNTVYSANPVYTIYAATDKAFSNPIIVSNITATSYTLNGLTNGTPYYFKVTSGVQQTQTTIVHETPSIIVAAVPDSKKPNVPSGVSASHTSQQEVTLSWSKDTSGILATVAASVSYNIYYLNSTSAPTSAADLVSRGTAIKNITATSYAHTGLSTNTTYYYVITAVGEGESAPSSIVSVSL